MKFIFLSPFLLTDGKTQPPPYETQSWKFDFKNSVMKEILYAGWVGDSFHAMGKLNYEGKNHYFFLTRKNFSESSFLDSALFKEHKIGED
jgi:hypothetical protein